MAFRLTTVLLLFSVLLCGHSAYGLLKFTELAHTLTVNHSAQNGIKAGSGQVEVVWSLNTTALSAEAAAAAGYKTVQLKLCFGAVSQVDRPWRKTTDLLSKDKTCFTDIGTQPFTPGGNSTSWTVTKVVPFGHYFVRAYVTNSNNEKIAFGQTTNKEKTNNLFTIEPITGRHASIDIAAGVFSAFAVVSLFGFYFGEKKFSKKG